MKTLFALALVSLATASAEAALPPGAESLRRIAAIAQSPAVFKAIGNTGWISSIVDNNDGTYTVTSSSCVLYVKVEVKSERGLIGPGKLVIIPGAMTCLPR